MNRENISLWEDVLVLEGQFIHTNRERTSHNNSFEREYFTLAEREQATKWSFHNVQFIRRLAGTPISHTKLIKCGFVLRLHVSEFFKSVISY